MAGARHLLQDVNSCLDKSSKFIVDQYDFDLQVIKAGQSSVHVSIRQPPNLPHSIDDAVYKVKCVDDFDSCPFSPCFFANVVPYTCNIIDNYGYFPFRLSIDYNTDAEY